MASSTFSVPKKPKNHHDPSSGKKIGEVSAKVGSYWDLPGGKMEYGEKPKETVVREVKEETGLDVTVGRLLGVWQFNSIVNDYQVVCITFQCTALTTDINLAHNPADEEITEHAYATKEDLLAWRYPFLDESVKGVFERI